MVIARRLAGPAAVVTIAILTVAGCGSTASPSPSPSAPTAAPSVDAAPSVPRPSRSAPPPGASAPASSGPSSTGPTWRRFGEITATDGGNIARLGADAAGYVASEEGDGATVDWLSADGRSWQSGAANDAPPCPPDQDGCSSWSTPGGWVALASANDDQVITRSADGVTWNQVELPDGVAATLDGTGWIGPDGTLLLLLLDPSGTGAVLSFGSLGPDDAWHPVPYPATCPTSAELVLAPAARGQPRWAVSDGARACVSTDLQAWKASTLPVKAGYPIVDWVSTSAGILASGSNSDCICDRPFQLLSTDGVHWTKVHAPIGTTTIADGPAGILGITDNRAAVANQYLVWRLAP